METMANLADKALLSASAQPTTNTGSKPGPEAFRRLVPLWEHMTGIYGHKWRANYGDEVSETWVRGLADMSGDDLAKGLRTCLAMSESRRRTGDEDWPPTLGEFRALCKPMRPAYHEIRVALPAPEMTPEKLKEIDTDIANLRGMLAKRNREFELELSRTRTPIREPGSDDDQEAAHG